MEIQNIPFGKPSKKNIGEVIIDDDGQQQIDSSKQDIKKVMRNYIGQKSQSQILDNKPQQKRFKPTDQILKKQELRKNLSSFSFISASGDKDLQVSVSESLDSSSNLSVIKDQDQDDEDDDQIVDVDKKPQHPFKKHRKMKAELFAEVKIVSEILIESKENFGRDAAQIKKYFKIQE